MDKKVQISSKLKELELLGDKLNGIPWYKFIYKLPEIIAIIVKIVELIKEIIDLIKSEE